MIKKEYQKPTMEVCEAEVEMQLLVVSLEGLSTSGLDDDDFEYEEEGGDQGYAW